MNQPLPRLQASRPRPRLLILTPDFPPAHGGIQLMAHRLATGLPGLETRVVALDSPGAREFDRTGALALTRVRAGGSLPGGRVAALNAAGLARGLRFRPHVTLSMHIVASPAAAGIRRASGARVVQYFHAEEIGARPRLAAFAARSADATIAVSSYTAELARRAGAPPERMRVIPPGVDIPAPPTPASEEPARVPTVLTVARMEERYKGHDVLARAMALVRAKVSDASWVVIGDGSLRPAIEQLASSYGLDGAVRFLGSVPDEQRERWLWCADVIAMPSRLPAGGLAGEGFGIAFLEAGAHGKPVVAGNVGGALDSVLDGVTGLLVDPLDHLAVAEAIARLLLDRELAARLGRAGAERARQFAWPAIAQRVEALLLEQAGA